jgi:hypothetical protein
MIRIFSKRPKVLASEELSRDLGVACEVALIVDKRKRHAAVARDAENQTIATFTRRMPGYTQKKKC